MRLAAHPHHHIHLPHVHLSTNARRWLYAALSAAIPYLIAALALFAYHEQWFR